MKLFFPCALLAIAPLVAAGAEPVAPEAEKLIDRIEAQSFAKLRFNADSAVVAMILKDPKQANPEANADTWKQVGDEFAAGYTDMLIRKGGMMDQLLRAPLSTLTIKELRRLSVLLDDPAYQKYQAAMGSADMQRSMQQVMMSASLQIGPLLNQILGRHGLKEVH